ncbi:restriction endonuclease subunit S [Guyparkeria sp. GHLCS8-2]|uniref:restriction endonuclease subunit S n=1 Tax=Guyparkeria halopsychrophila TaxID=3139421 RepID=UPI0037CBC8CF
MTNKGSLPTSWTLVQLGELGDWGSGGTPTRTNSAYYGGNIPWLKIGDLTDGPVWSAETHITQEGLNNSSAKPLEPETILIAMYGSIGKVGLTKIKCATNQAIAFCRHSPETVDQNFLLFGLRYLKPTLISLGQGGAQQNISQTLLKRIKLPLPPLNEQRRIVEKIETLFARLDQGEAGLREVQALLTRYRQSVLKAAVTGELTADWRAENAHHLEHGRDLLERILLTRREHWQGRGKYKEPAAPNTSELPELPEGWVWASLDALLIHLTSGSRGWKKYYGRGEGVFIMAQNVRPMRFDLSEKFRVDPPPGSPDAIRSEVRKDDILITIVGANTGDVCRFHSDERHHYVCQSVALLRPAEASLSHFLEMFLASKGAGRDQLEKFIYGAGRPHLSFEQLRSVAIPLPPLEEQAEMMRRVSEKLSEIQQIEETHQTELTRSAALRQSILKDAFAGRLVPQDPNDEPAADLLARLRAAREAEPKKPSRRKTRA